VCWVLKLWDEQSDQYANKCTVHFKTMFMFQFVFLWFSIYAMNLVLMFHNLGIIFPLKDNFVCDSNTKTERRGRVINTPASYSGGPGLKSRPGHRLS
jgi:hypothetical protein